MTDEEGTVKETEDKLGPAGEPAPDCLRHGEITDLVILIVPNHGSVDPVSIPDRIGLGYRIDMVFGVGTGIGTVDDRVIREQIHVIRRFLGRTRLRDAAIQKRSHHQQENCYYDDARTRMPTEFMGLHGGFPFRPVTPVTTNRGNTGGAYRNSVRCRRLSVRKGADTIQPGLPGSGAIHLASLAGGRGGWLS